MTLAELMQRLLRLEAGALQHAIRTEPKKGLYFRSLLPGQEPQLMRLWIMAREVTDNSAAKLYSMLANAEIVDLKQNGQLETRKPLQRELALWIAFHKFSRSNACINVPHPFDFMKTFVCDTIQRLFEKYGWQVDRSDSSAIRPLHEWEPEDRQYLVEMLDQVCAGPHARTGGEQR